MGRRMRVWAGLAVLLVAVMASGCSGADAMAPETAIPSFTESGQCGGWSCSSGTCGYDTATDPRGACCLYPTESGETGAPKPSCDTGYCLQYPNSSYCTIAGTGLCSLTGRSDKDSIYCDSRCVTAPGCNIGGQG